MIIDAHLHVFAAHSPRRPRTVDELAPAERTAPIEDLTSVMAAAGVDRAVLVPLGPEDDYVTECRRARPGTFVTVAVADDETTGRRPGLDPVGRLRERAETAGFAALRMNWLGEPRLPLTESPAFGVLRELARTGTVLWFYAPPEQLPLLAEAVRALPDLPVVLNHLGFCPENMTVDPHGRPRFDTVLPPPTLPAVLRLARHPQVRVMFSGQYAFSHRAYPYRDLDPLVGEVFEAYGADRLMWASDYPWTRDVPGYASLPALVEHQLPGLTATERAAVLGGTAKNLFADVWGK
ncbi:amidohydrolase family protein [Actinoallomurus sp. NBC_01490]|uniref:amidohydrolase family protein n=1 Tax=Actinoallomurus sp. NBC_01490 TaxID=2903557 RepID=UPI002E354D0D|nr:amidohydrolase family protein [Actinoallomurus sp. NBC_01490]